MQCFAFLPQLPYIDVDITRFIYNTVGTSYAFSKSWPNRVALQICIIPNLLISGQPVQTNFPNPNEIMGTTI